MGKSIFIIKTKENTLKGQFMILLRKRFKYFAIRMNLFYKTILFIKYNLNYNVNLWKCTDKNLPNSA